MSSEYVSFPYVSELENDAEAPSLLPKLFKSLFSSAPVAPVTQPRVQADDALATNNSISENDSASKRKASKSADKQDVPPTHTRTSSSKRSTSPVAVKRQPRPYRLSTIAPPSVRLTHASGVGDLTSSQNSLRQMPVHYSPRASLASDVQSLSGSPTMLDLGHSQSINPNFSNIPGFPLSKDILQEDTQSVSSFGTRAAETNIAPSVSMVFRRLRGEGLSREYWMDDASATACFDCESTFTALRRKHHCRLCGQIYCSKCASNIIPGHRFGHQGYVRVCNLCLAIMHEDSSRTPHHEQSHSTNRPGSRLSHRPVISSPLETQIRAPQAQFAASTLFPRADFPPAYYENEEDQDYDRPETPIDHLNDFFDEEFHGRIPSRTWSTADLPHETFIGSQEGSPAYAPFRQHASDENLPVHHEAEMGESLEGIASPADAEELETEHDDDILDTDQIGPELVIAKSQLARVRTQDSNSSLRDSAGTPENRSYVKSLQSPLLQGEHFDFPRRPQTPPSASFSRPALRSRVSSRATDVGSALNDETPVLDTQLLHRVLKERGRRDTGTGSAEIQNVNFLFLRRLIAQCLQQAGIETPSAWEMQLIRLLSKCTQHVRNDPRAAGDSIDIRKYIKIKRLPGGRPSDSEYVHGVVFTKNLLHKQMFRQKHNPRIMLLALPLEYQKSNTESLLSLTMVLKQEKEYLKNLVGRIVAQRPHVVLVERNVSGLAVELLKNARIAVARNVKPSVIHTVSRLCQADVITSLDRLALEPKVGRCGNFAVQTYDHCDIPARRKTFLRFDGCQKDLGATVILRGGPIETLTKLKQITKFLLMVAFSLRMESYLLHDEHVSLLKMPPFSFQLPIGLSNAAIIRDAIGSHDEKDVDKNARQVSHSISTAIKPFLETILSLSPFTVFPPPYTIVRMQIEDCALVALKEARRKEQFSRVSSQALLESPFSILNDITPRPTSLLGLDNVLGFGEDQAPLFNTNHSPLTEKTESYAMAAFNWSQNSPTFLSQESLLQATEDRHADMLAVSDLFNSLCFSSYPSQAFDMYRFRHQDSLRPQDHQTLMVLYSVVNSATLKTCIAPELRSMQYYGESDQTLGQFLENYVSEAHHACLAPGCQQASLLHYKVFVHNTQRVTCILEQFPCPVPGGQERIYMWSYCKICENPAKHTIMSEQTWCYSFAKYLELSFYPSELGCRTISPHCEHNPHRDHVRYFALKNLAVRIYSDQVQVNEIRQPPLALKIRPDVQLRLRSIEMEHILTKSRAYWGSLAIRLSTFNYDSIASDLHDEARAALQAMSQRAQQDSANIEATLDETHKNAKWSSGVALNAVRKLLQEKVVEWDNDFSSFEQKFVPTEKDIRRLTGTQLRKLFEAAPTSNAVPSAPGSPESKPSKSMIFNLSGASTPLDALDSIPSSPIDYDTSVLSKENLATFTSQLLDLPKRPRENAPSDAASLRSSSNLSIPAENMKSGTLTGALESGAESDSTVHAEPPSAPALPPLPSSSSPSEDEKMHAPTESKIPRRSNLIRRLTAKETEEISASGVAGLVRKFDPKKGDVQLMDELSRRQPAVSEVDPDISPSRPSLRRGKSDGARSARFPTKRDATVGTSSDSPTHHARPFRRSGRSRGDLNALMAASSVPSRDETSPRDPHRVIIAQEPIDSDAQIHIRKRADSAASKGRQHRDVSRIALSLGHPVSSKTFNMRRTSSVMTPTTSQTGRVLSITRHFDRISREAERERQKRLNVTRSRKARPVTLSKPTLDVYTTTKEALQEDSDDNEEHSDGADDEFEEDRGDDDRVKKSRSPALSSNESFQMSSPTELSPKSLRQKLVRAQTEGSKPNNLEINSSCESNPNASIPPSPMLAHFNFPVSSGSASVLGRLASSQFSESEMSSSGTDNKNSLIKTISNLWAYRGCDFSPLEYPLKPTEHLFSNNPVIVREDEPSSIIAFSLASRAYKDKMKEIGSGASTALRVDHTEPFMAVEDLGHSAERGSHWGLVDFVEGNATDVEESLKKTAATQHFRLQFEEGACKFSAKVFFAGQFDELRRKCGVDEAFIESMARCVKWDAAGGKSGSAFLKTIDDRFIVKEISRLEMDAFLRFAPSYFDYMSRALFQGLPTLLAKILGFFRIGFASNGRSTRMDVLVMENLFYERNVNKIYDLKGSKRNRHVTTTGRRGEVLLDENLTEMAYKSPLFVREQSKKLLRMSLFNDTLFLERMNVMDYSLVVGVDETTNELIVGIVDFVRQYTWDKKLESWVKGTSRIEPTIINAKMYKNRLRNASEDYFLLVPDKYTSEEALVKIVPKMET